MSDAVAEVRAGARAVVDQTRARLDRLELALDVDLDEVNVDGLDDELRELIEGASP
jgi:hypothetical protein